MGSCCVFFHAHPDDEALLTAGTMARLAAEGHRVVLVMATSGEQGLSATSTQGRGLGAMRTAETFASARALGCARVEFLGYGDSGLDGRADTDGGVPTRFGDVDVDEAAAVLADLLREEQAALLTTYDPAGGYGHPDHVQVHRVGARAAEMAGTPVVLQATVDRDLLCRALRVLRRVYPLPFDPARFDQAYTPARAITHRIDVRRYSRSKRQSMSAHVSQTTGGESVRTLAALLRLPGWLFRRVLGTEWYVQAGVTPGRVLRDPLATVRRG